MKEKERTVYLNNAATSWPKPACVYDAVRDAVQGLPPGQYRSGSGQNQGDVFDECRDLLGKLLGIGDAGRIFFTSGATESMNLVLKGLGIPAEQVITTVTEHNSVLRPLYNLPGIAGRSAGQKEKPGKTAASPLLLPCDENGSVDPAAFEQAAAKARKPGVVILNHCSNVTGAVQDAAAFGRIAKRYGFLFLLDVSQSAGCMEVDADAWMADAVIFTGHKSLLGIPGTGGFFLREGVPYSPAKYGGTGKESQKLVFGSGEASLEVGTQNVPGICALKAGVSWILERGVGRIREHEQALLRLAADTLSQTEGITLFGANPGSGPVLSFCAEALSPSDLGYILNSSYHIVTRSGLHCSPLIHDDIGSGKKGTVRISFSPFTTREDILALAHALQQILQG